MACDFAGETGGGHDEAFLVRSQQRAVKAGLFVEPFGVRGSGETTEVLVPFQVAGKQDEMVVAAFARLAFIAAVPGRHVRFHPEDGLDTATLGGFLELPRAVHHAVIGQRDGSLAFVATLYPSWRASRVQPAEALRYE